MNVDMKQYYSVLVNVYSCCFEFGNNIEVVIDVVIGVEIVYNCVM